MSDATLPNATLAGLRDVCATVQTAYAEGLQHEENGHYNDAGDAYARADDFARAAVDAFVSLDEWLSHGGSLPDAWNPAQRTVTS